MGENLPHGVSSPEPSLPPAREWLTLRQAAERFHVSVDALRNRKQDGSLPCQRFGPRLILVRIEDLEALFHRVPTGNELAERRRRRAGA